MQLKPLLTNATIGLALLIGAGTVVEAGDAKAGEEKSGLCAGCHGADGISLAPDIPNLAGQKEAYLIKAIKDYRSNKRKNPMMNSMAANLSDEDIADLAAFFSRLKSH